jgi:hypothetical protein
MDDYYATEVANFIVKTYIEKGQIGEALRVVTTSYLEPDRSFLNGSLFGQGGK